jgi:hypothetical protein
VPAQGSICQRGARHGVYDLEVTYGRLPFSVA